MLKRLLVILFVILSATPAFSQGGMNYSIFGIGDINTTGNASYDGVGGTSIAFPAENSINFRNPAMWSYVTTTRINVGYKFNQTLAFSDLQDSYQNFGALNGISGLFMIDTGMGIAASFGIHPYSNINYMIASPIKEIVNDIYLDGRTIYQGKGGISMLYFGGATKITKYASVGASVFSTFGKVSSLRKTEYFGDPYAFTYISSRNDFFSGFGYKAGLSLKPITNLTLGFYYENQPNLDVETDIVFESTLLPDTSISRMNAVLMPDAFGFGIAYETGKFIIGADLSIQDFSNFNYNNLDNSTYRSGMAISAGINRIGNKNLSAPVADRMSYKLGAYFKQHYYSVYGNDITEMAASLGFQVPWAGTFISDIALTIGSRGTQSDGLIREYFGKISVDISIGETWFKPFKRDY